MVPRVKGLTKRENQIAGLAFCGLARKEMADRLDITTSTVNIHTDKAYKKTGTSKLNELGAWWINNVLALEIDFEELKKSIVALSVLGIMSMQVSIGEYDMRRVRSMRPSRRRTETVIKVTI